MDRLLIYCRPGFEGESAGELQKRLSELGAHGYAQTREGYLSFVVTHGETLSLYRQLARPGQLIFPRQVLLSREPLKDLPTGDRITPLLDTLRVDPGVVREVWVETPDTNDGKALGTLARRFTPALVGAMDKAGLLRRDDPRLARLHLLLLGGDSLIPALSLPGLGSPWPMGIPRLKRPRDAPSRSTLKLDEALQVLLSETERQQCLQPGMRAVDLGAAPGGWTWQLVQRHLWVTAVDNAALAATLFQSGLVSHHREDGFRFRPARPVDWMVCDMVEQPIRIARLVAGWFFRGDCRHCIFNLKLPMKRRLQEVERCQAEIHGQLRDIPHQLRLRQLYHDREEITGYLGLLPKR